MTLSAYDFECAQHKPFGAAERLDTVWLGVHTLRPRFDSVFRVCALVRDLGFARNGFEHDDHYIFRLSAEPHIVWFQMDDKPRAIRSGGMKCEEPVCPKMLHGSRRRDP